MRVLTQTLIVLRNKRKREITCLMISLLPRDYGLYSNRVCGQFLEHYFIQCICSLTHKFWAIKHLIQLNVDPQQQKKCWNHLNVSQTKSTLLPLDLHQQRLESFFWHQVSATHLLSAISFHKLMELEIEDYVAHISTE